MATAANAATAAITAKRKRKARDVDTRPLLWPSVIVLFLWMIVPLAMTVYFSVIRYNLLNPDISGFAGTENYAFLFEDPALWASLWNTLLLTGSVLIIVVLRNIRKAFGDVEVIKGVDLHINDKEFAIFVGPSGCGKSTLLRMIAGLESVTDGDLTIGSERVNDLSPSDRGISMVFQTYALYPHMTVRENMGFSLKLAKVSKDEISRKVNEAARILELQPLLDRKPKALSGGQRQRVAIGRAIVRNPQVFLFDEPLSNLDAALRVQMRIEIARMHSEFDATMIYVTHDQVEAMTMADKIVVLQAGVVEQVGSPLELYHHPQNQFVAGFIGSPTMNFLGTEIQEIAPEAVTVGLPGGSKISVPVVGQDCRPGDKITLGVRPEHLLEGGGGEGELRGKVLVVERLGGSTFIHAKIEGDETITAELDGNSEVKVGDQLRLGISAETCHLFAADGLALEQTARHPLADIGRAAPALH